MNDQPDNSNWHDVDLKRLTNVLLIILACIIVPIVTAYIIGIGFLFLIFALIFGEISLPVVGFYAILIASLLIVTFKYSHGIHWIRRSIRLFGVLFSSVLIGVLTAGFTQDLYQKYRIFNQTPRMEKFLERKYDEDFVIISPYNCSDSKWGPDEYVCAKAYSKNDSDNVFFIAERHGGYREDYSRSEMP